MERLRDNDSDWGKTRIEYAAEYKRRKREREKKRRQRAAAAQRPVVQEAAVRQIPYFETSGIRAVTIRMMASTNYRAVNRTSIASVPLSLPYVSIQHRSALDRGERK